MRRVKDNRGKYISGKQIILVLLNMFYVLCTTEIIYRVKSEKLCGPEMDADHVVLPSCPAPAPPHKFKFVGIKPSLYLDIARHSPH